MTDEDLDVLRRRPRELAVFMLEATVACLEQRGLDPSIYVAFQAKADMDQEAGFYLDELVYYSGLLPPLTPEAAAISGYRTVVRPYPPEGSRTPELPAQYFDALVDDDSPMVQLEVPGFGIIGAPSGGCVASSAEQAFGSVADWLLADQFVVSGIRQFAAEALETAEVRTVAEAYATCMRDSGYEVANPAQAAQIARDRWIQPGTEAESPGPDEIEMAEADAKCQATHPVLVVAEEMTIDLASEWVADNPEAVTAAAAAQRRALDLVAATDPTD
ncbi:MAG: hypothetical protein R2823_04715 [Acidimicrobiia bacterium]